MLFDRMQGLWDLEASICTCTVVSVPNGPGPRAGTRAAHLPPRRNLPFIPSAIVDSCLSILGASTRTPRALPHLPERTNPVRVPRAVLPVWSVAGLGCAWLGFNFNYFSFPRAVSQNTTSAQYIEHHYSVQYGCTAAIDRQSFSSRCDA